MNVFRSSFGAKLALVLAFPLGGISPAAAVPLDAPIDVAIFYLTAAVLPEDGAVHFAEDVYGHDARLSRALAAQE